jgi:AP-3 complex subunit delta-1
MEAISVPLLMIQQLKAERLERMRDDPYYIVDDPSSKPPPLDVDSIPVVRLDDLPPMPKGQYFVINLRPLC